MPVKSTTTKSKDVPAEAQVHEDDYEPKDVKTNAKTFIQLKKAVLKHEETNYNRLYLFPCSGNADWRMMGGHSALFYFYHVIRPLNRKVRFIEDASKYPPISSTGLISAKGTKTIRKRLRQLDLYQAEYHKDGLAIFYLTRTFTKRDVDLLWQTEQKRREELNSIIEVKNADPELMTMIMNATKRLYHVCDTKLKVFPSRTIGVQTVKLMQDLVSEQYRASELTDTQLIRESWRKMLKIANDVLFTLQMMNSWEVWSKENCASIAKEFIAIIEYLEKKLAK